MEMHSKECWLPAVYYACVAAMTLKNEKTRPKFFQDFQSSNQHGTVVKSPFFEKMCVLWERFPVRRDIYLYIYMFFLNSWNPKMGKIDQFWCWHVFSQLLESKKWGKLTSFGVDMFFSQLLESKKWGKLTSFGVDMFLSQLLESKKWWKLTSFGVDMFLSQLLESKKWGKLTSFSTPGIQKNGKID